MGKKKTKIFCFKKKKCSHLDRDDGRLSALPDIHNVRARTAIIVPKFQTDILTFVISAILNIDATQV